MRRRYLVGVTGASGGVLALETVRLLRACDVEVHLVISNSGRRTVCHEVGEAGLSTLIGMVHHVHAIDNIAAPVASGSFPLDGMAIVPCSMRTLSAVAHGASDNLLTRAADVTLKERRRLVILPREAPLHEIHLAAMLTLARMGVIIAPPVPPFYTRPSSIEDMVREIAARTVGWLGCDPGAAMSRWTGG